MMEPIAWTAVAMAAVSNMATWLVIIKNKNGKNNGKGSNLKAGTADICIKRGEKIAKMENEQINVKEDIHEIKESIQGIFGAINSLRAEK